MTLPDPVTTGGSAEERMRTEIEKLEQQCRRFADSTVSKDRATIYEWCADSLRDLVNRSLASPGAPTEQIKAELTQASEAALTSTALSTDRLNAIGERLSRISEAPGDPTAHETKE